MNTVHLASDLDKYATAVRRELAFFHTLCGSAEPLQYLTIQPEKCNCSACITIVNQMTARQAPPSTRPLQASSRDLVDSDELTDLERMFGTGQPDPIPAPVRVTTTPTATPPAPAPAPTAAPAAAPAPTAPAFPFSPEILRDMLGNFVPASTEDWRTFFGSADDVHLDASEKMFLWNISAFADGLDLGLIPTGVISIVRRLSCRITQLGGQVPLSRDLAKQASVASVETTSAPKPGEPASEPVWYLSILASEKSVFTDKKQ